MLAPGVGGGEEREGGGRKERERGGGGKRDSAQPAKCSYLYGSLAFRLLYL